MPMRRVMVIGCGGAGKSTLARQLSAVTGLPLIGLDRAYWRSGWVEPPKDEWRAIVAGLAAEPAWVMDGNYSGTFDLRMPRADTVVWLDTPRTTCLWRVVLRLLRDYGRTRADLPDGCPEKLDAKFLRYVWDFPVNSRPQIVAGLQRFGAHLRVIQMRHDRDAALFLREVA
jgi:adenylate kinase family enzyme